MQQRKTLLLQFQSSDTESNRIVRWLFNSQAPRELGLSSPKLIFVCGSFSVARNHTTRSPLIDRVSKVDLGPRREFRGTTGISVELTLLQDVSLQFQLLWCVVARDIACMYVVFYA